MLSSVAPKFLLQLTTGALLSKWQDCVGTEESNLNVPSYWEAHSTIHWQDFDRGTIEGVTKIIEHYANEEEDFDIYQLCAFESMTCKKVLIINLQWNLFFVY